MAKKLDNDRPAAGPPEMYREGQERKPLDRQVKPGHVRVRATSRIGEEIDGRVEHFTKGEVFDCPEGRAKALGPLVEAAE